MKKNIILIYIAACSILSFSSCVDGFEGMNTNPNAATEVTPGLLFPLMQRNAINGGYANYQTGENLHANQYSQWVSCTASYFSSDRYVYNNAWVTSAYWNPYYFEVLKNLRDIKEMVETHPEYEEMYHIARIMTAIGTARTTDVFGDIPYSEGSTGLEKPKYDAQKDIYYDIFKELTEATNALTQGFSSTQIKYGSQDLIYEGNVQNWIKLGNSLRLRYALRLSFIDPKNAKIEGEAALTSQLMSSIADNAGLKTNINDNAGIGHPFYTLCYWNEFRMSETFETVYKNASSVVDPRMECYWGVTEQSHNDGTNVFKGLRNGLPTDQLTGGNAPSANSNIWGLLWAPEWNSGVSTPSGFKAYNYYTMCYSEICLLKAEAALRSWTGAGNAKSNYEDGIRASFQEGRLGVSASLYTTTNDEIYIATGSVGWNDANSFETKLNQIATQKWIALFPNGTEAWAEVRRTGYPKLIPIVRSDEPSIDAANGEFIKKLRYPDDEKNINGDHAGASSLNDGKGDGPNIRVWWDTGRYK